MKWDKTELVLPFKRVLVCSADTDAHLTSPPRVAVVGQAMCPAPRPLKLGHAQM